MAILPTPYKYIFLIFFFTDFMIIGTKNKSTFKMNIALVILLTTLPNILAEQKFVIEPEDVSVELGTHITLPCRVTSKQGVLQWTKDDFGLGTHRNLSAFERYSMIGNDDDGDYSLKIDSVSLEDDAKFQCQVSPGPEGTIFFYYEFLRELQFVNFKVYSPTCTDNKSIIH